MERKLTRLLWQHYRRRLWATAIISFLVTLVMAQSLTGTWALNAGKMFNDTIMQRWQAYPAGTWGSISFFPGGMPAIAWVMGWLFMHQDLKDNFNQFLFSSGYQRRTIYRHKLALLLGALLSLVIVTTAVTYLIFWVNVPHSVTFNWAWPGVVTGFMDGLMASLGFFAIGWFAALIIGQTVPLLITVGGFTVSLIGVATLVTRVFQNRPASQLDWATNALWLMGAGVLFIWGSWLYQRLSLEHNGEYLLFPGLRMPVFITFVVYLLVIFLGNGEYLLPTIIPVGLAVICGGGWLWWPEISQKWQHGRR